MSGDEVAADRRYREWVREAITMALYVSLSLLALIGAAAVTVNPDSTHLALTVLLTGLALVVAHHVAFRLSSRFVNEGRLDEENVSLLLAQAGGGVVVAVVAALPVLVLGSEWGVVVSSLLLFGFVAAVAYWTARAARLSRLRALVYVGIVGLAVVAVLVLKSLAGH